MINLFEFDKYDPRSEYLEDERRSIDLDNIRKSDAYRDIIDLGFAEETSDQQELNNTLKFRRKKQPEVKGYADVFYTIHPTGVVRRYNPIESSETPEGQGNTIRNYPRPFRNSKEYKKALRYLFNYLRRKELREDYR
jgi:hypothetical protein